MATAPEQDARSEGACGSARNPAYSLSHETSMLSGVTDGVM
jgi:hypothetical protein